ncbi:MAG TPA: hypothetical protein VMH32_06280 [Burkholderiales bacterium]|nr:hypothetical protein [Burkholderiales bacterium]
MRLISLVIVSLIAHAAWAEEPPPAGVEGQPPAIREATRIGVALGAGQRCGMSAEDVDMMAKLALAHLQLMAKNRELYGQAAKVMLEGQRYGAAEMPQPEGGCKEILPMASGILGNLTYIVARADLDVPNLNRASPLENFAAWSGQLAVMASHCGARDEIVDRGVELSRMYLDREAKDERTRSRADAELSQAMLEAELGGWGDQSQCVKILTTFGTFFGNLDARLQK